LLKQPQFAPFPVEEEVVVIFAGTRGYLDRVDVGRVGKFEQGLIADLKSSNTGILDSIRNDRQITKDVEKKLEDFLADYTKRFIA
jgi:F-type H+-transporting ATPase subunit alpha